jgi:hypothetical protein
VVAKVRLVVVQVVVAATLFMVAITGLFIIVNHIGATVMVDKVNSVVVVEVIVGATVVDAVITGLAIIPDHFGAFVMLVKLR